MTTPTQTPASDLVISQGATFRKRFVWKAGTDRTPVDITGATARLQVRTNVTSTPVLLELSTENGGITLGGTAGTIDLYISATDTHAPAWTLGVYDLFIYMAGGDVVRLIRGTVYLEKTVTHSP